jgi:spermidine/putrescine transport system ATP-binding protein
MTMADEIVIMHDGRIEQQGSPSQLYEQPRTAFVAGFLGVSNLLYGSAIGEDRVRLDGGIEVQVPREALAGRTGKVQIGVRPEKLRLGSSEANSLSGRVAESAYIGVSTQYIIETPAGAVTVYVQNDRPGANGVSPGDRLTVGWRPDCTFVVDVQEGL